MALTKAEVKTLTEADEKLQWWAGSVLFAEISELVKSKVDGQYVAELIYGLIENKVNEFERLVVRRQLEKITEAPNDRPRD